MKHSKNIILSSLLTIIFYFCFSVVSYADNFFSIKSVRFYEDKNRDGIEFHRRVKKNGKAKVYQIPFVEIRTSCKQTISYTSLSAKVYFYDENKKMIGSSIPAVYNKKQRYNKDAYPTYFEANKSYPLYFLVPENVSKLKRWSAIAVFGDYKSKAVASYPSNLDTKKYDYYEKELTTSKGFIKRDKSDNPIIEKIVYPNSTSQSKLTLLFMPMVEKPKGIIAICVLANSVGDIKKKLLTARAGYELGDVMNFATKHNMALLCWGSSDQWDESKNWTDIQKDEYKNYDKNFDSIARSWSNGVNEICKEYKIENKNFILFGTSGAAQYAMRLALRVPQYFKIVNLHIPSSFDKPTAQGANILWCLTTGELESGFGRSVEFFNECKKMNYLITYKAVQNWGHREHAGAREFALEFCEFALSKDLTDKQKLELFKNPPYYGDIIYQEVYPNKMGSKIKENAKVSLPTKELADRWKSM